MKPSLTLLALCTLPLAAQQAYEDAAPAADTIRMDRFEVTGTRQMAMDTSTLKMGAKVIETPRAVTIIDESRIREQDFQNAGDLLFWVPGLNSNGDSYHFYARGFRMLPGDWKVDGFTNRVIGGSYTPNLFGVEAVSVLKGPAGLLYGATSSPGGQISLVTKKPKETPSTVVELRFNTFDGSDSHFGEDTGAEINLDSTGPVSKDGRLLYRLLSSVEHAVADPSVGDDNQFHRLSFSYKVDQAGRFVVTPMVEYSKETRETRSANISPSSSLSTADNSSAYTLEDMNGRDVNLSGGSRTDENLTFGTDFTGKLTESWNVAASLRYHERDYSNNSFAIQTATLTQQDSSAPYSWTVKRRHTRAGRELNTLSFDVNSALEKSLGTNLRNVLQLGFNGRIENSYNFTSNNGANQSAINIYTGVAETELVEDANPILSPSTTTHTFAYNAYLQNRLSWKDTLIFGLSGGYVGDQVTTNGSRVSRSSNVKPNASLVWMVTPKTALYTSYSTSYNLPSATYEDNLGNTGGFNPIEGESFEVGAKAELLQDLVAASLSLFDTSLNNTLVLSDSNDLNSNGNQYYRQLDAGRKSKGVELEFTFTPLKNLEATATYAYIDAYNRDNDGNRTSPAELTPKHALSLYTRYAFAVTDKSAWALRGGIIWQDKRYGSSISTSSSTENGYTDPLLLASFHRIDLGLSHRRGAWDFALNIENVTNELYLVTGSTGLSMTPVRPRQYSLRISHTW